MIFGDRLIMKLFRRVEPGVNPELEIGRVLTDQAFPNAPSLLGALEYREGSGEPMTLAVIHRFVPNSQDAWQFTLDILGRYYERALSRQGDPSAVPLPKEPILDRIAATAAAGARADRTYLESAGCSAAEPPSFIGPGIRGREPILPPTFHSPLSAFHVPVDAHNGRPGARTAAPAALHAAWRPARGRAASDRVRGERFSGATGS